MSDKNNAVAEKVSYVATQVHDLLKKKTIERSITIDAVKSYLEEVRKGLDMFLEGTGINTALEHNEGFIDNADRVAIYVEQCALPFIEVRVRKNGVSVGYGTPYTGMSSEAVTKERSFECLVMEHMRMQQVVELKNDLITNLEAAS